jgi:hypothetical protein
LKSEKHKYQIISQMTIGNKVAKFLNPSPGFNLARRGAGAAGNYSEAVQNRFYAVS